ncbi:MAG: hypothetical protein V3R99_02670 [Thermoguttaceae bacterium]
MWKTVGVSVLRCGAIFGVFGVFYFVYRWSRPAVQEAALSNAEPCGNDPTA